MNSKSTVAIIAALLSGATLAADALPSARLSELNWLQASPAQLQVLGLGNLSGAQLTGKHQLCVLPEHGPGAIAASARRAHADTVATAPRAHSGVPFC